MGDIVLEPIEWRELIAEAQHKIWADWMRWLFEVSTENADGTVTIPADKVERWKRQIETPYAELSEDEKWSDRHVAFKVVAALSGRDYEDIRDRVQG